MIKVDVKVSGPLFDARGPAAVKEGLEASVRAVAQEARSATVALMMSSFKRPRPMYWTTVDARPTSPTLWKVTDTGLPYGHWLEGTGTRNYPVTSFRGYRSFRRGAEAVRGRVAMLVARSFAAALRKLGGS